MGTTLDEVRREMAEEEWRLSGDIDSFRESLAEAASKHSPAIDDTVVDQLSEIVEGYLSGSPEAFRDRETQPKLAAAVAEVFSMATMALEHHGPSYNRVSLVAQIDSLVVVLKENIRATEAQRNEPPAFDLALTGNAAFLAEVKRLTASLEELRKRASGSEAEKSPESSLAKDALREFVMKLSGKIGDGVGETVTWGTRLALGYFAIGILRDLNIPVSGLLQSLSDSVLPTSLKGS